MTTNRMTELQDRLATASADDFAAVVLEGLVIAWPPTEVRPSFVSDLAVSFDHALGLIVQTLPGWGIKLDGRAVMGGPWSCTLRDTGLRDDDEVIGIGQAATAPLALLTALLQVLVSRSKGYG